MPILAHSTREEYVSTILREGLRLPNETGNSNFGISKKDRISFLLSTRAIPKPNDETIELWSSSFGFILNQDYVNEHTNTFKYEQLHKKDAKVILKSGFEKLETVDSCAVPFEIVSIKNIPLEGICALVNNIHYTTEFLTNIKKQVPEHIKFYTINKSYKYERIK